ncbi:MAG: hypothetical protein HUJ25_07185 [Crocinitomicaceae bacterium]|nr:hypothetical protein [Crocinitomicaceae bacterium]
MIKKVIGILTIALALSFITIMILLIAQGKIEFKASMVKLAMANLTALVVFSGLHLTESHSTPSRTGKFSIWGIGVIVLVLGILVSYDIVDYKSTWNQLLAWGVIFITLIQLQLLKWEKSKSVLKVMGLIMLLSNLFISVYFMAKLSMIQLGIVLDIAVTASVFAFLVGLILSRSKKDKKKPEAVNS